MRLKVDKKNVMKAMETPKGRIEKEGVKPPFEFKGEVPEMIQALSIRPDIMEAMQPLQKVLYFNGKIDRVLKEKIFVKVSTINQCQFCTTAHTLALKNLGQSNEDIENIKKLENLSEKEKVALQYAEQVTIDANNVSDELFSKVKEHFSDEEIVELTLSIGMINLLNKFNDALKIRFNVKNLGG